MKTERGGHRGPPAVEGWVHKGICVWRHDGDDRRLEWELVVPATIDGMWAAWVQAEAVATWGGPVARVDLRPGGDWHVYFDPDAPPGQRGGDANVVASFIPGRELRIKAGAPPEFPTVRASKTDLTIRLDPVGFGHVRVHVIQSGWRRGEEWDRAFETMAHATAEWLSWLHRRFTLGPMDWHGVLKEFPPAQPAMEFASGLDRSTDGVLSRRRGKVNEATGDQK